MSHDCDANIHAPWIGNWPWNATRPFIRGENDGQAKGSNDRGGAPVTVNQNSRSAGADGPLLLEDHYLIEKLAHFERERIPERVVHAKGWGAFGYFEVTADVTRWTKAKFLSSASKRTEMFIRFSTVAGEKGYADTARDPRGFSMRFYTEDGNYDLVVTISRSSSSAMRSNSRTSSIPKSAILIPGVQEPDNVWDFFSLSPEMTHHVHLAVRRPRASRKASETWTALAAIPSSG